MQEIEKPEDIGLGGKESDRTFSCFDYSVNSGSAQEGGHFRFVWAVARGNRGLAIYLSATGQEKGEVRFNGSAYVFEQGDDKK